MASTSKKKITLDGLAAMMNASFEEAAKKAVASEQKLTANIEALRQETAGDIAALRSEMNSEFADLRRAHNYGPELDELRRRVKHVEEKVGIHPEK